MRPGTYAAALPMRPVMVFIPDQKRQIIAQFRQNSLLRLERAMKLKWCLTPCRVRFSAANWLPSVRPYRGTYQSNGALQSLNSTPGSEGVIATIELNDNVDVNALPDGIYAQVAVYSDHFTHVSVMRKVLLRMTSWVHYLYLDH